MGQIYITGDKHGDYDEVLVAIERGLIGTGDVLIVLGDAGVNYYGDFRDAYLKAKLNQTGVTFMFVRGNHEARPSGLTFHEINVHQSHFFRGWFIAEDEYPNLLYMKDGGLYVFVDPSGFPHVAYVIGGAYSVDKYYRLQKQAAGFMDYKWFPDEQLNEQEMASILEDTKMAHYDFVFSHTVPESMAPHDRFLSFIDQSTVDHSTESFLQKVMDQISFQRWFAGHWHTDRSVDRFRFMFHDIIPLFSEHQEDVWTNTVNTN